MLAEDKHISLLGPLVAYEENEVLWVMASWVDLLETLIKFGAYFCKLDLFRALTSLYKEKVYLL